MTKYIALFLFSTMVIAIEPNTIEKNESTSTQKNLEETTKNFEVNFFLEVPSNEVLLSVDEGRESLEFKDKRIQYVPSGTSHYGLYFKVFDFDLTLKTELFSEDSSRIKKYGKSQYRDIRLSYDFGLFNIKTFYQKVKGFYADLNSTSGFTTSSGSNSLNENIGNENQNNVINSENIIVRSDIRSINWGGQIGKNWVLADPYHNDEAMFSSSIQNFPFRFSLITSLNYSHFYMVGDSAFIPSSIADNFGPKSSLSSISYDRIGLDFGMNISWYLFSEKSTFNFGFNVGPDLNFTKAGFSDQEISSVKTSDHLAFLMNYAYKGTTHQFQTGFEIEKWSTSVDVINVDVVSLLFNIQYGFRF